MNPSGIEIPLEIALVFVILMAVGATSIFTARLRPPKPKGKKDTYNETI
jgi:hypothetical protein